MSLVKYIGDHGWLTITGKPQVEYLPLPALHGAGLVMQPVLSNLLLSVLPNVPDPKLAAITLA